jgi:hypothetical protein
MTLKRWMTWAELHLERIPLPYAVNDGLRE